MNMSKLHSTLSRNPSFLSVVNQNHGGSFVQMTEEKELYYVLPSVFKDLVLMKLQLTTEIHFQFPPTNTPEVRA